MHVHNKPCSACPYRKDCPSGVWDKSEYLKLAEYDKETYDQPIKVFLCHDGDRTSTICRGWLDTHQKHDLLSLRLAVSTGAADPDIFDLPLSDVPCFESGQAAHDHGVKELEYPSNKAIKTQHKLIRRHPELNCCTDEDRNMNGGCINCGDPCL